MGKNRLDVNKLKYLTVAMDCLPDKLNPSLYLSCQAA